MKPSYRIREEFLPYALPMIGSEEIREVIDSLRSGWITTGPKVRSFESEFAKYIGTKHAIAVNSCTAGLHIALAAFGISRGDEVIVPTLTFCSTANVVVHLGARPVLVDIGEDYNVTPEAIEAAITKNTKAVMPVLYSGQVCDLDAMSSIADGHGLALVQDAAHAVGARYHDQMIGSDALSNLREGRGKGGAKTVTVFSFYAIKNMTTGEGGMITAEDDELAARMRSLSLHGMSKDAWRRYEDARSWYYEIEEAGFKQNMTDIQASLGIHQLRKLDGFIEKRTRFAHIYSEAFAGTPELDVPLVHERRRHAWHLYVLRLRTEMLRINRDQFIQELSARNIGTSVHFIPVHLHPFYQRTFNYKEGDFPIAEHLYQRIISLPLYPRMTEQDVVYVADSVLELVKQYRF